MTRRTGITVTTAFIVLTTSLLLLSAGGAGPQTSDDSVSYDLLIRNGRIVDGSGEASFVADVAIRDGRIQKIGKLEGSTAERTIDAAGLVVAPGFIDAHMHADAPLLKRPAAANLVRDGVTSIITGNCGGSVVDVGQWFTDLESIGVSINVATLIGHNTVRRMILGLRNRAPSEQELARMKAMVSRAMRDGALGFSTGLLYVPGNYAETDEVVALARVAAARGGLYATHIRSEKDKIFEAIEEAFEIARAAEMPLQISHFKIASKPLWGQSDKTLAMVEKARAEGLDVTLDQYPYDASSTSLATLIPAWAHAGGKKAFRRRIGAGRRSFRQPRNQTPSERKKIAAEMLTMHRDIGGWEHLDWAVVASSPDDASLNGKNLREINLARGREDTLEAEIETVIDLYTKATGRVQMVYHVMSEEDVERIMAHPLTMVGRDGGTHVPGATKIHPRSYGAAARILGRYVREKGVLTLELAVRKLTALPAIRFGLKDRGMIKEGYWADITIFDPETVIDTATFENPHQYSTGIPYVLVNGQLVVDASQQTSARPGQMLRRTSE